MKSKGQGERTNEILVDFFLKGVLTFKGDDIYLIIL